MLPVGSNRPQPPAMARLQAGDLFVHDPKGTASAFLKSHGIAFTPLGSLTPPVVPGKVWLVGQDALSAADTSSTAFAAYAASGGRVLLLEQEHPLRYQGLGPAEVEFQTNVGRTAFAEDLTHPLLRGLQDKDFFTWEPGEVVYKNAYLKPQRGARSLVQCNESLLNSALLTIPVNDGLVTLCQLVVGQKLAEQPHGADAAAERAGLQRRLQAGVPQDGGGGRAGAGQGAGFDQPAIHAGGRSAGGDEHRAGSPSSRPRPPTSRRSPPTPPRCRRSTTPAAGSCCTA